MLQVLLEGITVLDRRDRGLIDCWLRDFGSHFRRLEEEA